MEPLQHLDAAAVCAALRAYHAALEEHAGAIDRINVFPVADGDTGTNMRRTMAGVIHALPAPEIGLDGVLAAIAEAALRSGRGNSGLILAAFLTGVASTPVPAAAIAPAQLVTALENGAALAEGAVSQPVPGTILTVAAAAAGGARSAAGASLPMVLAAAAAAADEALLASPQQLTVLRDAGVVDAGGAGFVLLLAALRHVVEGAPLPRPADGSRIEPVPVPTAGASHEVMFAVVADASGQAALRAALDAVGESVVVSVHGVQCSCHVHTDDPEAAVEAAVRLGMAPEDVRVSALA